jgi:hypothetical protein
MNIGREKVSVPFNKKAMGLKAMEEGYSMKEALKTKVAHSGVVCAGIAHGDPEPACSVIGKEKFFACVLYPFETSFGFIHHTDCYRRTSS